MASQRRPIFIDDSMLVGHVKLEIPDDVNLDDLALVPDLIKDRKNKRTGEVVPGWSVEKWRLIRRTEVETRSIDEIRKVK